MEKRIGVIILAAGQSSRLGQPKQLLTVNNETFIARTVNLANQFTKQVITVLGHQPDKMRDALTGSETKILVNKEWRNGMGSSLKSGLKKALEAFQQLDGILILVCDQPGLTYTVLEKLLNEFKKSDDIVASVYENIAGVPVIFGKDHFDSLQRIEDHSGAKAYLDKHKFIAVEFPEGVLDIDTPEDLHQFLNM